MSVETVRAILVAESDVTDLVGQRVSPVIGDQDDVLPYVALTRIALTPQNHLAGVPTLDAALVQLDIFAATYAEARAVATACRDALEAAGLKMENEQDDYEFAPDEYRVIQEFYVWE